MIYLLVPVIVPVAVYILLPWMVGRLFHKHIDRNALLVIACLIYFMSWYVPSPLIEGRNTSFTTHVIGGGIFSGLLWLYIKEQINWKGSWGMELVSLFAFVSAFGVLNELFELTILQLHLVKKLNITDTSWDLLANTIGALVFWVIYKVSTIAEQYKK